VESGLIPTVRSVEEVINQWRAATVESAAAGGPAHVTALYPWRDAPVPSADLEHLAEVLRKCEPVTLTFDRLDRFPSGVLTRLLMAEYPECLPYGGEHLDPHPHLTVACGSASELDEIEPQVLQALRGRLPLTTIIEAVVVMEQLSTGRWNEAHCIGLGQHQRAG
jgi:2'-5' RNA ligase